MVHVTKQEDEFIFEQPRWIAHLSNGERIYKDDGRPGVEPPQAWLRLAEYCRQNHLFVVNLTLQFRSHHEAPLPANADGYYFTHRAEVVQGFPTVESYVIGYLNEGRLLVQQWRVPELVLVGQEYRDADRAGPSLIRRYNERWRIVEPEGSQPTIPN
jgi:hypothetical protein